MKHAAYQPWQWREGDNETWKSPRVGTLNNPNCGGLLCTPILNISPVLPTSAQQFPTTLNLDMERRPRDIQDRPEPGIYEIPCKPKARNEPGKLGDQSLYPSCDQKDRPPSNGPISTTSIDPEQTILHGKKTNRASHAPRPTDVAPLASAPTTPGFGESGVSIDPASAWLAGSDPRPRTDPDPGPRARCSCD